MVAGSIDAGIRKTVEAFQANGIETIQSCEGGAGHAYPEPTIEFSGTAADGWRAIGVCITLGVPVLELRRVWEMMDGCEPVGPHWAIVFRRRPG